MEVAVEGFRLGWALLPEGAQLTVASARDRLRSQGLVLRFISDPGRRRLKLTIVLRGAGRAIDVSPQPGLVPRVLTEGDGGANGTRYAIVGGSISRLAASMGAWHPPRVDGAALEAIVGGAAFPVLGAAYARNAAPLREVPMWAVRVFREPTARAAARAAFGDKATRPVISAFARALAPVGPADGPPGQPPPPPNLAALALGLIGVCVLEPDELARLLQGVRASTVPSGEQIRAAQEVASRIGPARARRVLADAGESDRTMAVLADMAAMYVQVGQFIGSRPAGRLPALHGQCLELMPREPDHGRQDRGGEEGQAVAALEVVPGHQRPGPGPVDGLPPVVPLSAPSTPLRFPPDILSLDQQELGRLRLVLPRTTSELARWGQLLSNCLGSYGSAAASGRCWLIGTEVAGRLAYCMEISPERSICQFSGHNNRTVPARDARAVLRYLAQCGIVEPTNPANIRWYGEAAGR